MRHFLTTTACVLSIAIGTAGQTPPAATLTVRGTGIGADEKAALQVALGDAVKQVVIVVLEAPARKKHESLIAEKVLAKPTGLVKSHEVLKSEKSSDGKVTVRVRADVDRAAVMARLTEIGAITKEDSASAKIAADIVKYCKENQGKKVGDGECGTLAREAVAAAGGKPFSDYKDHPDFQDFVWGELVFALEMKDGRRVRTPADAKPKPGDIIQYRNAMFRSGGGIFVLQHHTAVVAEVKASGELVIFEQNMQGRQEVTKGMLRPNDIASGWIRVYRPVPK